LTLSVESKLDHVWAIRAALGGILNDLRVTSSEVLLIQLAVSEILSNVIEHSYQCQPDRRVIIAVRGTGTQLQIDITDDAPPFSSDKLQQFLREHDIEEEPDEYWAESGHGLQIARRAVDSISFGRSGDRNYVTLVKHISINCE
jgi:anti-sigma regulatory factor (Ser/Thr protein kinase)